MKKILSLLLSTILVSTTLIGCASEPSDTSTDPATDVQAEDDSSDTADADSDALKEIQDRGTLRVGVKNNVVGFGFQDPLTGDYDGLEIELANKLGEEIGVDVEFTNVTAATRTQLLDSGDLDCVIATFTITDERKESWDFTTPYYTDYVTVLVENSSNIAGLEDLVDKKVGVSSGSTSARSLVQEMIDQGIIAGDDFSADTFDPNTWTEGVKFQQYDDYPTISTALTAGEVDAFCVDKSILSVYNTDDRSYIDNEFSPQDYGIATKKDSAFSDYVEESVTTWLSDGTIDSLIAENGLN